ncbi:hypothetical protein Tco_0565632 [Tanacetum coccineum]
MEFKTIIWLFLMSMPSLTIDFGMRLEPSKLKDKRLNHEKGEEEKKRVNVDATCTPHVEQPAPVVGDEGIKGLFFIEINKRHVSFSMIVTGEVSRKIDNLRTLMTPMGNGA